MLSSHNTIPSKSVQPQDGRGEAGGGAGVEVGDRDPIGLSNITTNISYFNLN